MPLILPLLLAAQISTQVPMGSAAPVYVAPLPIPRRHKVVEEVAAPSQPPAPEDSRLSQCLAKVRADPASGLADAQVWLADAPAGTLADARANQCLGMAQTGLGNFAGAEQAFGKAVDAIPPAQAVSAVPLMGMAGNAALAAGQPQAALGWFDKAVAVTNFPDRPVLGGIQADRARALVALGRGPEAETALGQARVLAPQNSDVWLLSATLARRDNQLAAAQTYIERAATLAPRDPAVGLEAGVIAVLSGRDDAARESWRSVLQVAPESAEAKTAQTYLDQLAATPAKPATREPTRP